MFKIRWFIALLAAIGMIGVACGGDSDDKASVTPTQTSSSSGAGDYFSKVAVIFLAGQTGSNNATDTLNVSLDAAQSLEDKKAAIANFLNTMLGVFDTATSDMGRLDPPAGAKDAHDLFRQDIESAKQKSAELRDQLAGIASDADLDMIVDKFNSEVEPLVADSTQACRTLQTLAGSEGITVDLSCDD